jgi:hypothetical protein
MLLAFFSSRFYFCLVMKSELWLAFLTVEVRGENTLAFLFSFLFKFNSKKLSSTFRLSLLLQSVVMRCLNLPVFGQTSRQKKQKFKL